MGLNGLQETAFRLYPEIRSYYDRLAALAPGRTIVSGSGPTVVAAFSSHEGALAARRDLSMPDAWTAVAVSYLPADRELPWT